MVHGRKCTEIDHTPAAVNTAIWGKGADRSNWSLRHEWEWVAFWVVPVVWAFYTIYVTTSFVASSWWCVGHRDSRGEAPRKQRGGCTTMVAGARPAIDDREFGGSCNFNSFPVSCSFFTELPGQNRAMRGWPLRFGSILQRQCLCRSPLVATIFPFCIILRIEQNSFSGVETPIHLLHASQLNNGLRDGQCLCSHCGQ